MRSIWKVSATRLCIYVPLVYLYVDDLETSIEKKCESNSKSSRINEKKDNEIFSHV